MATKKEETTKKTAASKTSTSKKVATTKKEPAKKATTKATTTKKETAKKTTTKTATTKKASASKASTKKPATTKKAATTTKKTTETKQPKIVKANTGIKIEQKGNEGDLLGLLSATPISTPEPVVETTKPKTTKKTSTTTKKTAEKQPTKTTTPTRVIHKPKTFTKEEKVLYKRLEEAFNYVANLTMVIEERTLDAKLINDLTLGELHVLEIVNKEATIPMTKVANQLKITVGSLTTCVNRLVKKEYLFRERDENDHRIIKVSTTQKAKKALKVHDLFHEQILLGVLDGVTIRDATKVMAQFARTLENYINPKEKNYDKPIETKKKKNS